jgi:hypothetical protein
MRVKRGIIMGMGGGAGSPFFSAPTVYTRERPFATCGMPLLLARCACGRAGDHILADSGEPGGFSGNVLKSRGDPQSMMRNFLYYNQLCETWRHR